MTFLQALRLLTPRRLVTWLQTSDRRQTKAEQDIGELDAKVASLDGLPSKVEDLAAVVAEWSAAAPAREEQRGA